MAVQTTPPSSSMSTAKPGTTEGAGPSQPTPSTTMPMTTSMAGPPEAESTIQRLSEHRNVRGVIILNRDGVVIRSSGPVFQGSDGVIVLRRYASEASRIVDAVGSSVDRMELDAPVSLTSLRMKVKESRILRMLPLNKKFIDSLLRAAQCFSGFCNLEHSFPTRRKILKSDASVVVWSERGRHERL
ncbi:hypothetical protein PGT21_028135 [Puccinia graminis f. sp. tritici]|uniref:Roadblock/LAMTOR2 domain-containing protein n=1 Tax=Puccinia graminis f. sp. tritici TaxID=56615 RepID=A0A5B0QK29_PUCGR|nr:hypothetical protein PGT21_028135 [Puccinia graminis f. sp. tritici]